MWYAIICYVILSSTYITSMYVIICYVILCSTYGIILQNVIRDIL